MWAVVFASRTGSERTAGAYMRMLWEMARDLVEMETAWNQIEALANALLERKRVTYSAASTIIRNAMLK